MMTHRAAPCGQATPLSASQSQGSGEPCQRWHHPRQPASQCTTSGHAWSPRAPSLATPRCPLQEAEARRPQSEHRARAPPCHATSGCQGAAATLGGGRSAGVVRRRPELSARHSENAVSSASRACAHAPCRASWPPREVRGWLRVALSVVSIALTAWLVATLTGVLSATKPVLGAATPVLEAATPTLQTAQGVLQDARPVLHAATPVLQVRGGRRAGGAWLRGFAQVCSSGGVRPAGQGVAAAGWRGNGPGVEEQWTGRCGGAAVGGSGGGPCGSGGARCHIGATSVPHRCYHMHLSSCFALGRALLRRIRSLRCEHAGRGRGQRLHCTQLRAPCSSSLAPRRRRLPCFRTCSRCWRPPRPCSRRRSPR